MTAVSFSGRTTQAASDTEICEASGEGQIATCTRLIESGGYRGTDLARAYFNRGVALQAKGETDRAIADYDEAIRLNPKSAGAYNNRGHAQRAKGDNDRAIADFDQAIRLDPSNLGAYIGRALAWRAKGDNDRAIADYDQTVSINPKYVAGYIGRGAARAAKADNDRAIADYDRAIALDPKLANAYRLRGHARAAQGDTDRANADYDQANRLDPKFVNASMSRGSANFQKGRFGEAASDFLWANDLEPNAYAVIWRFMARARVDHNDTTELETAAARLKTHDWPYPVIDFYLGRRTAQDVQSFARKPEEKCEAAFYLGEWYLMRGRNDEAQKELQKAAAATCPKGLAEYQGALAELKRLGR
jgi:lipoprotein NlpI